MNIYLKQIIVVSKIEFSMYLNNKNRLYIYKKTHETIKFNHNAIGLVNSINGL